MHDLPKLPPENLEAEQALLGTLLANNETWHRVSEIVEPVHFVNALHGRIFETCGRLIEKGQVASVVTLKTYLEHEPAFVEAGGVGFLASLTGASIHVLDSPSMARLIRDLHLRRQIIALGLDAVQAAYNADVQSDAIVQIETLERGLYELVSTGHSEGGLKAASKGLAEFAHVAEAAYRRDGKLTGLSTGFRDLDQILGGLHRSDLIVLAGRPSMGKTALATNIAYNVASAYRTEGEDVADGGVVGFFSLEMAASQLMGRVVAEKSAVPHELIRQAKINNKQMERVLTACTELEHLPFYIDDSAALSLSAIRNRARRFKRQNGLGLIVVDYLQLITPPKRSDGRVNEVSEISRGLKQLAKELDVPVLALSQLSRGVESREDKRPLLSDLRESGSIEQDADVVMFVYRDHYYAERAEPNRGSDESEERFAKRCEAWQTRMARAAGRAEVLISKHRHGPTGIVHMSFDGPYTRFGNVDAPSMSEAA